MFERRLIRLPAHAERLYDDAEWQDELVVVACGAIELEGVSGERWRFEKGAILWLQELPLRAIHNPSAESAILVTVSRPMNSRCTPRPS
jgi:hypothetical protein